MSASIQFLDCRLSLVHIPLHLYPHFVQAILTLILPLSSTNSHSSLSDDDDDALIPDHSYSETPSSSVRDFINISVTPVECSVVCSKESCEKLFAPIAEKLESTSRDTVKIEEEEFVAIQVDGEGLDAGQRVLELTSPLALAGISIFFITTYFSDYILVSAKNKNNVVKALHRRGFVFEKYSDSFVTSPTHYRNSSSLSSFTIPPSTPPHTTTVDELSSHTFATLKKQNVVPHVNKNTKLIQCAGRRSFGKFNGNQDNGLFLGLVKCFISQPQFMSVTLTNAEPASLILQKEMLHNFGPGDALLGSKNDVLIPIVLDLRGLPVASTGIVCGVAGRLIGKGNRGILDGPEPVEMSYLSTARAGTVMVAEEDIDRAIEALGM
ncbi:hypothetical protein RUND412_006651 [Rhizina undulata]